MSVAVLGCGAVPDQLGEEDLDVHSTNLTNSNGLRLNGLRLNGLRLNGLRLNGLDYNGLRLNGAFIDWFNHADAGDIATHAVTMKYVVGCALRSDQSTSFTDRTGAIHTWKGGLGLAPSWFTAPATDIDRDWLSACLMAHVNTAAGGPKSIQISLRGNTPALGIGALEAQAITTFDGAFFGDLFASPNQMYICKATTSAVPKYTETLLTDWGRQCFFSDVGCEGFTRIDCGAACTMAATGAGYHHDRCTVGGRSFRAINVFVPKFTSMKMWSRTGAAYLRTDCVNCLDGVALDGLSSSSLNGANRSHLLGASGTYIVDFRYANGTTTPQNIRFQVNGVDVMNGTSNLWDFAPTGGRDVWRHRELRAYVPAGGKLAILSAGTGKAAPLIDTVSFRVP